MSKKNHKGVNTRSSSMSGTTSKTNQQGPAPIEVAQWPLNGDEVIRLRLSNYRGRNVVDLRVWYRTVNGHYAPGPRGLTVDVRHLRNLSKGFRRARSRAKEAGLLPDRK